MKDSGHGAGDPLAALHAGDPGPFEAYVSSEARRFLGFFARLGATRAEAEDLVQETFLKLFRLASKHDGAPGADYTAQGRFDAYAFRVARNVWIDRTRRAGAEPPRAGEDAGELPVSRDARRPRASEATRPDAAVQTAEESSRIRAAVAELPETHRLVFELGVVQELPYAEIAGALDIPVGTVKSRMFHAVKRVRDALQQADELRARIAGRAAAPRAGGARPGAPRTEHGRAS